MLDRLFDAVLENATGAEALLTCGSLPAGVPPTFHRDIVRLAMGVGAYSVVDASGDALTLALDAGPDLVKPNVHELAELTGGPIGTLGDVVAAAQALRERGAGRWI